MRIARLRSFMSRDGDRPRVIVALDTQCGIIGWGECYNHGPDRALPPLLDYLTDMIIGEDPRRVEYLTLKLVQQARFPPGALGLAAIAAIDQCLWDIAAKALGVPVYQILGGAMRDRVRVYQGIYTAPDPAIARDRVQELNDRFGLTAFKLSPYRVDMHAHRWGEVVREAGDYFRRLREVAPGHFDFAFDAHAKIFEPWQAVQLGNALAPYDPLFFEEPIRPEHFPAWGELKSRLNCPLATGESLYSRYEFLALLNARGVDIIQPDVCVVGGVGEMRRIWTLAEAHYVSLAPHNPMGPLATAVNLHLCLAAPNFKILEYRLPPGIDTLRKDGDTGSYVVDPYLPEDGHVLPRPDRPGWGVEVDEEYLATDRYVRWERKMPRKPDGSWGYP